VHGGKNEHYKAFWHLYQPCTYNAPRKLHPLTRTGYHTRYHHTSRIPLHAQKVVPPLLAPCDLFPAKARHVDDAQALHRAPPRLLAKPGPQLLLVHVLVPLVRPLGHDAQHVLGHDIRDQPARPRPRDGAHDEPAAGLHVRQDVVEEGAGRIDVLQDLEERHDVKGLGGRRGQRQRFNRRIEVRQPARCRERRVAPLVALGDPKHPGRRVDGRDRRCVRQARCRLGEDAAATANVEVPQLLRGGGLRATPRDEGVTQRVHEVQQPRGAVGVPPARGQCIEVRDLGGVDSAGRGRG
jgi:hypothetical protein